MLKVVFLKNVTSLQSLLLHCVVLIILALSTYDCYAVNVNKRKSNTDLTTVRCRANHHPSSQRVNGVLQVRCMPNKVKKNKVSKINVAPKCKNIVEPKKVKIPKVVNALPIIKIQKDRRVSDLESIRSMKRDRMRGNFDTFYIGLTGDYNRTSMDSRGDSSNGVNTGTPGSTFSAKKSGNYDEEQIQSGYLSSIILGGSTYISEKIDILVGLELELSITSMFNVNGGGIIFDSFDAKYRSELSKLSPLLACNAKIGYMINGFLLPYFSIGPGLSRVTYSGEFSDISKLNNSLMSVQCSIGLDVALTSNVHARFDYSMYYHEPYKQNFVNNINIGDNLGIVKNNSSVVNSYNLISNVFRVAIVLNF